MTDRDIRVGLDATDARRGLRRLQGDANDAGNDMSRTLGGRLSGALSTLQGGLGGVTAALGPIGVGVAAVTAAVGGAFVAFKSFADEMDRVAKQSRRLGTTTEELISLRHAADQSGVEITIMEKVLAKTAQVSKETGEEYKKLGINLDTFTKMPAAQRMEALADAFAGVTDPSERLRRSVKMFGEEDGPQMITMLENGGQALRDYRADADAMGLTVSQGTTAQLESFNDSLDIVGKSFIGVGRTIMEQFAPAISGIMKHVAWFAKESATVINIAIDFWGDKFNKFIAFFLNFGKYFQVGLGYLEVFWTGAKLFSAQGINSIVEFVIGGINELIGGFSKLFDGMPQKVKEFLGIDPKGWKIDSSKWTIDTKGLAREAERAGITLADTIASDGAGDTFYKNFREGLKESVPKALDDVAEDSKVDKAAKALGGSIASAMIKGSSAADYKALHEAQVEAAYNYGDGAYYEAGKEIATQVIEGAKSVMLSTSILDAIMGGEDMFKAKGEELSEEAKKMVSMTKDVMGGFGSSIAGAFQEAFSGGDFGEALKELIGQQLMSLGTSLIQSGAYMIAMSLLASVPVLGSFFGGPGAAATGFAAGGLAIGAGVGIAAAGAALGSSGGSTSKPNVPSSVPSSGSSNSFNDRRMIENTGPASNASRAVVVNFNTPVSSRRAKRELMEVLA